MVAFADGLNFGLSTVGGGGAAALSQSDDAGSDSTLIGTFDDVGDNFRRGFEENNELKDDDTNLA